MRLLFLLLLGCRVESPDREEAESHVEDLPAPALLRRISLDLRGRLPSDSALDFVETHPEQMEDWVEDWMQSEAFEERIVHLLQQRWRTRIDVFDITSQDLGLTLAEDHDYHRAVGEEPLRLMARVVMEDRPWREILTTGTTRIHHLLAPHWPVDYPEGATGWQDAHYTDGRPPVGVLATNGLWWRYTTTESNLNRGRSAEISRLLLCEDYLERPISFADDDFDDPEEAVRSSPYCLACHSSLDPVAGALFGFWWLAQYSTIEESTYHPEREALVEEILGTEPAWFGQPMSGLADLGARVANDPRFTTCAVETWAELLWQRELVVADRSELETLRRDFLRNDQRIRPLISDLLQTDGYRAGRLLVDTEAAWASARTRRMMSPDQLASTLEELTGFVWERDDYPMLDTDEHGYRILAGGMDGLQVTAPSRMPGLTWAMVVQRAAQGAAWTAMESVREDGEIPPLLGGIDLEAVPGEVGFESNLETLHWRLFAQRSEDDWVSSMSEFWERVYTSSDADQAWTSVLSVMLRDPLFVTY